MVSRGTANIVGENRLDRHFNASGDKNFYFEPNDPEEKNNILLIKNYTSAFCKFKRLNKASSGMVCITICL
jgi:hypothetical protein